MSTDLTDIQKKILDFRNARDWKQFHDPKNLAEAISIVNEAKYPVEKAKGSSRKYTELNK